jgi:hypothetical protein
MRALTCFIFTLALSTVVACGGAGRAGDLDSAAGERRLAAESTEIATAAVPRLEVFADAGGVETLTVLEAHADYPLVLSVTERREGMAQVQLPVRPNGALGWVREGEVELSSTDYSIEVDLGDHRLVLHDGSGRSLMEETVAVGSAENPTPTGMFYVFELLRTEEPGGAYGPFAFGLSGHSEGLSEFAGGDGRIGIHGTDRPDLLGGDVSHGCVRLGNDAVVRLAELVPLGTPVEIHD